MLRHVIKLTTPAQNARPAPVRMMAFTAASFPKRVKVFARSTIMGRVNAFSAVGRFIVMVTTPDSTSETRIRGSLPPESVMDMAAKTNGKYACCEMSQGGARTTDGFRSVHNQLVSRLKERRYVKIYEWREILFFRPGQLQIVTERCQERWSPCQHQHQHHRLSSKSKLASSYASPVPGTNYRSVQSCFRCMHML